jgi:osmotically-inducible protein OsmY
LRFDGRQTPYFRDGAGDLLNPIDSAGGRLPSRAGRGEVHELHPKKGAHVPEGVSPMYTDLEIKRRVEEELRWEPRIDAANIGIAVEDGVVTLSGSVDSWAEKWAAEHAAKRVAGVAAVVEHIEVRLPVHAQRTDADIARAVANALTWNTWVPADTVKVKIEEGWVTLEGAVGAQYQKRAAEEAVRNLTGVRGVTNLIDISPGVRAGDVKEAIRLAFERSASLDLGKVEVDVEGDTVSLHGTVRSWAERDDAEDAAWSAPGIVDVNNLLVVSR